MASKAPAPGQSQQTQQPQQPGGLPNAQPREPIKKERGKGMVKAVSSGDTVILLITPPNAPPSEKQLTFSHVSAPRLAAKDTKDEPFAWDSREHLRKKLIGKQVTFTVENKATNREYGFVFLNEENVAKTVVSEGWAKAIAPPGGKEPRGEHAELIQLTEAAQAAKLGIWNTDKTAQERSIRNIVQKFDQLEVFERLKGRIIEALIDQVRTGSTYRVLVTDEGKDGKRNTYNLLIRLAGAQSPNIPFSANKDEEVQAEPFAKEAKLFSEVRLLHRVVQLTLKGLDHKGDSFTGKIAYAGKNVAEELIKAGFASFVEWNAPREDVDLLRATEGGAKAQGLRIWQFAAKPSTSTQVHSQPGAASGNPKEFSGKVRDITNYGAIAVTESSGVRRLVNFSSINLPRTGGPGREDEPYAWEAREFLRSKLIGKRIKATLDYERQLPNSPELRGFYSVYLEKNNIALLLVDRGFAKVVPHKADEKRSSIYEALVIAERKCQKKAKGVHGKPENAPIHRVNDLTLPAGSDPKKPQEKAAEGAGPKKAPDANKAKQFLPFLKRAGRTPAVIEYVVHASKYKLYIPKESCLINFVLTGIKVPQRRPDGVEPFADEALEYVRKKCHQRDVEVEVETQDKGGNFIGNLWVGRGRKLFAETILEQGLATINAGSASHSSFSHELFAAEDKAKRARKNIWKNYDESQEQQPKKEAETEEMKPRKEYLSVVVTEVLDGSNFFVNVKSDELTQLELLMEKAQEWANQMAPGYVPAPNDKVLAQFPVDNKWYRGRLIGKAGNDYKVSFVDFGNIDVLPLSHLRPLRDPALAAIPPQAKECFLAFIKPPAIEDDFGRDAAEHFSELTRGKTMWANVEYRDREGRLYLSLGDPQSQVHVNAAMVHEGLARVEKRSEKHLSQLLQKLREEEDKARKAHLNIWQYGDIADDDDDEHYDLRRRKK